MKKFIALFMVVCLACALVACGKKSDVKPAADSSSAAQNVPATEAVQSTPVNDDITAGTYPSFAVEEQKVYESDNVRITVLSGEDSYGYITLKMKYENMTDKDLTFVADSGSTLVNGLSVDANVYESVAAGKYSEDEVSIADSILNMSGITEIHSLVFNIRAEDPKSFKTVEKMDNLNVAVKSAKSDYQQIFNVGSQVVYDKNDVVISYIGKDSITEVYGQQTPCLKFSIENNSDKTLYFNTDEAYVNNGKVTLSSNNTVSMPHSKGIVCFSSIDETPVKFDSNVEIRFTVQLVREGVAESDSGFVDDRFEFKI